VESSNGEPAQDAGESREEEKAAAEAGAIGGEVGDEGDDPAERPVAEGGGGVAEGFEQAEEKLIENAGHGEGNPEADGFTPEDDPGVDRAVHGEADEVESATREGSEERPDRWEGSGR
jgi:hypothetical protein